MEGDPSETFRLTLRGQHSTTGVEALKRGVGLRIQSADSGQDERLDGRLLEHKTISEQLVTIRVEGRSINGD